MSGRNTRVCAYCSERYLQAAVIANRSKADGAAPGIRPAEDRPQERARSNPRSPEPDQRLIPPSTLRIWPVMNDASSEAMKTIALACSSERPKATRRNSCHQSRLVLRGARARRTIARVSDTKHFRATKLVYAYGTGHCPTHHEDCRAPSVAPLLC
jgi:hypothetical protein